MKNPYTHRALIKAPNAFFGRETELLDIFGRLDTLQPCSIVGPRRIGKSSLLYRLTLPSVNTLHLSNPETYIFAYLDLQRLAGRGPEDFMYMAAEKIIQASQGRVRGDPDELSRWKGFERFLEQAQRAGQRLVLCCDEFECLGKNNRCNNDFFSFLRALISDGSMVMVTASRLSLYEICRRSEAVGSEFWNIFTECTLGLMPENEVQALIFEPFIQNHISITHDEVSSIRDLAGAHPLFLNIACCHLYHSKTTGPSREISEIENLFLVEARHHYDYTWGHLEEPARLALLEFLSGTRPIASKEFATLKAAALLIGSPDVPAWVSKGWQTYVKGKAEESPTVDPLESGAGIVWLHLSDLHFCEGSSYDENIVLKALLQDLVAQIQEEGLQPDWIAITGDLAFSAKPAEYELAQRFLDDLLAATGVPKDRLFLVPGNHDVDRERITRGARNVAASLTDRESVNEVLATSEDLKLMLARFEGYAAFVENYFGGGLAIKDEPYSWVRKLEVDDREIAVLCLNSVWTAQGGEKDRNCLVIGERQTRAVLAQAEGVDLTIALMHHPFDWLRDFDRDDSASLLTSRCDFILHGHMHQVGLLQTRTPDSKAMIIAAGACYETRQHPNSYNLVRLDLDTGQGMVYLRTYSDKGGGFWTKDVINYRNVPDGVYAFTLG